MASTTTDRLSHLPTELRLKLYSIIFPTRPVLQIRRQWLSASIVSSHADLLGDPGYLSLRQERWKRVSELKAWSADIEDSYLEAMIVAAPDGERRRSEIISDAIHEGTGEKRSRKQVSRRFDIDPAIAPTPNVVRVFRSRGNPRLQPLPPDFHSLMLLNRRFHREVVDYVYSNLVFDFAEDVKALSFFSPQTWPEWAGSIKRIRFEHVERVGRYGGGGTINSLNHLDIPLKTLLPNLTSLDLAIYPWPYYSGGYEPPAWATHPEQLGRLLLSIDARIHLSLTFESEIALPNRLDIAVDWQRGNDNEPAWSAKLTQVPDPSRLTCTPPVLAHLRPLQPIRRQGRRPARRPRDVGPLPRPHPGPQAPHALPPAASGRGRGLPGHAVLEREHDAAAGRKCVICVPVSQRR